MSLKSLIFLSVVMASQTALAEVTGTAVPFTIDGKPFQGYLAADSSQGNAKRPGILLVHEWWGHNDYVEKRARDYAALGYVAFATDMYGKGILTNDPAEAKKLSAPFYQDRSLFRSRAAAGLAQLLRDPRVDTSKVSALGYCFGGSSVLELARSGANLRGVISFHGGLATNNVADMKNFKGSILALNGAEDPMVPVSERATFMDELRSAGIDWQFVEFGGAVHAFTNPNADSFKIPGVKYSKTADLRSFELSKNFLNEIFSR